VSSKQLELLIRGTPFFDSPSGYLQPDPRAIRSLGFLSAYLRVDIGATKRAAFVFSVELEETNFSGDAQRYRTIVRRTLLTRFFLAM
jgi:hypothetical protein